METLHGGWNLHTSFGTEAGLGSILHPDFPQSLLLTDKALRSNVTQAWALDLVELKDLILSWVPEGWAIHKDSLLEPEQVQIAKDLLANPSYKRLTAATNLFEAYWTVSAVRCFRNANMLHSLSRRGSKKCMLIKRARSTETPMSVSMLLARVISMHFPEPLRRKDMRTQIKLLSGDGIGPAVALVPFRVQGSRFRLPFQDCVDWLVAHREFVLRA